MKKILSLMVALITTLTMFTACGDDDKEKNGPSNSSSKYFEEAVAAFSINATPTETFKGTVIDADYGYSDDCTLALYSDGTAVFAYERSYNGTALQAAGYYSTTYTKDGSTYILGTSGKTYIRKSSSVVDNQNVIDGCVAYEIVVSGSKITVFDY
ncbi:MAG: hypothetical protein J5588_10470 [Bacteroidales bacterium]|nr:hypothetical protein [Bacteroidales bacterium]